MPDGAGRDGKSAEYDENEVVIDVDVDSQVVLVVRKWRVGEIDERCFGRGAEEMKMTS